jgi:SpoVK/Ycf46/Vps4 family AAA+-type ATPase
MYHSCLFQPTHFFLHMHLLSLLKCSKLVTSRPSAVDSALLRPGRMDEVIELPVPDVADRLDIIRGCLSRVPHNVDDETLNMVAARCEGVTGNEKKGDKKV